MVKKKTRDITSEVFETSLADLIQFRKIPYEFTEKQKKFIALTKDDKTRAIFSPGIAGTGRTLLSVYSALQLIKTGKFDQITYVRNPVQTAFEEVGFIPGSIQDKQSPFTEVLWEKIEELLTPESLADVKNKNIIQSEPTSFLRGRTLNGVVIVDEAQSINNKSLQNVLTRIGEGGKLIVIGDENQKDIPDRFSSFADIVKIFKDQESRDFGIHVVEFNDEQDVKRSELVKFIIRRLKEMERYSQTTKT